MKIVFDKVKNERNITEQQLSFDQVQDFDFVTAKIWQDVRKIYSEPRYTGLGFLEERLHFLCFSKAPNGIRVISFRKANAREVKENETTLTNN